ncbi:MAG TPA: porin, partial [Pusillimonas sp.]|uniref:porin n=1 Tax=Pusillimonas sp. TaxID=3040095 RepID=UPI002C122851
GLGGSWGRVSAGRHYTLIHDILSMRAYDALWVSNYAELGWYSGTQYTLRRDNAIRYLGRVNQIEVGFMYQTNERGVKNSHSVMAIVPVGGLDIALAHETDHTADTELRASLLALRYTFNSGTSVHAYTLQSRAQGGLDKKDQLYSLGVVHPVSPRTTLFGSVYYNRSKANGSGHRNAFAVRAQYALSKRTFIYAEADHARVRGISVADFNDPNNAEPNTKRSSFSIGYRHLF